jgi:hypothetical protein
MSNFNISAIIKRRPFNLITILIFAIRGFLRRKFGMYSKLQLDKRIQDLNLRRGVIKLRHVEHEVDRWQKAFSITLNNDFKWDLQRDNFLEGFFGELSKAGDIPEAVDDKENFWSSVQLNWLFFSVRTGSKGVDESRLIILQCCKILQENRYHWLYRAFTVSEAISNIIKIKLFFGDALEINNEIEEFLVNGIKYVSENLEIYSFSNKTSLNHTNNHILSNTRALFWASKISKNVEILKLAEYLFEKSCLPLFDEGNLDEGSTTYHMIAAQCIFDISFFLPCKTLPRVDLLIFEMEKRGYLEVDAFPFIGDISPDPSLASVITDSLNIAKLVFEASKNISSRILNKMTHTQFCSDFEFYQANNWQFLLHTRREDKHIQHSHNDYGSPVLLHKGCMIICDLGRMSYSKKGSPIDLTSTSFHSVPQVDNFEQNPRGARDVYPNQFIMPTAKNLDGGDVSIRNLQLLKDSSYNLICGKEYNLLANKLLNSTWFRFFGVSEVNNDEFIIEDIVDLDIDIDINFRIFLPERIHKERVCTVDFVLNGIPVLPYISEVPCSRFYGDISKAYCYEVSASSPYRKHLVTQIRV